MRSTTIITLLLINILAQAQEQKKFEHWDDRYNKANTIEIEKTEKFLERNNIEINKIINQTFGVCKYTLDSLPYIEYYSNDTLVFLMPGGILPIEKQELELNGNGQIIGNNNCFIDGVRKDGRISLRTPHKFAFLIEEKKLYAFITSLGMSDKEKNKIIQEIKNAKTTQERDSLFKVFNSSYTTVAKLIVDLKNKNNISDTIYIDTDKISKVIDVYKKNGRKYFDIWLNFDPYRGRKDLNFTVDENLKMIKIEEFELENE